MGMRPGNRGHPRLSKTLGVPRVRDYNVVLETATLAEKCDMAQGTENLRNPVKLEADVQEGGRLQILYEGGSKLTE